jgi:hypothetical protein
VLKALHEKGATFLIINYDDFLEKFYNVRRINRSNKNDILKFKRRKLNEIFYIYRNYHNSDEIILDKIDYD